MNGSYPVKLWGGPKCYWLCCGSLDPLHQDDRAMRCRERQMGHPERCRFGTAEEHSRWEKSK